MSDLTQSVPAREVSSESIGQLKLPDSLSNKTVSPQSDVQEKNDSDDAKSTFSGKTTFGSLTTLSSSATDGDDDDHLNVVLRVRPMNGQEVGRRDVNVSSFPGQGTVMIDSNGSKRPFTFNVVFESEASQEDIFFHSGIKRLVDMAISGYSCTAFAFGQTGSGKTHTMTGPPQQFQNGNRPDMDQEGLIQRSFRYLLHELKQQTNNILIRASYLEIYNEQVIDLLNTNQRKYLTVRWSKNRGFYVENLFVVECENLDDLLAVLEEAMNGKLSPERQRKSVRWRADVITPQSTDPIKSKQRVYPKERRPNQPRLLESDYKRDRFSPKVPSNSDTTNFKGSDNNENKCTDGLNIPVKDLHSSGLSTASIQIQRLSSQDLSVLKGASKGQSGNSTFDKTGLNPDGSHSGENHSNKTNIARKDSPKKNNSENAQLQNVENVSASIREPRKTLNTSRTFNSRKSESAILNPHLGNLKDSTGKEGKRQPEVRETSLSSNSLYRNNLSDRISITSEEKKTVVKTVTATTPRSPGDGSSHEDLSIGKDPPPQRKDKLLFSIEVRQEDLTKYQYSQHNLREEFLPSDFQYSAAHSVNSKQYLGQKLTGPKLIPSESNPSLINCIYQIKQSSEGDPYGNKLYRNTPVNKTTELKTCESWNTGDSYYYQASNRTNVKEEFNVVKNVQQFGYDESGGAILTARTPRDVKLDLVASDRERDQQVKQSRISTYSERQVNPVDRLSTPTPGFLPQINRYSTGVSGEEHKSKQGLTRKYGIKYEEMRPGDRRLNHSHAGAYGTSHRGDFNYEQHLPSSRNNEDKVSKPVTKLESFHTMEYYQGSKLGHVHGANKYTGENRPYLPNSIHHTGVNGDQQYRYIDRENRNTWDNPTDQQSYLQLRKHARDQHLLFPPETPNRHPSRLSSASADSLLQESVNIRRKLYAASGSKHDKNGKLRNHSLDSDSEPELEDLYSDSEVDERSAKDIYLCYLLTDHGATIGPLRLDIHNVGIGLPTSISGLRNRQTGSQSQNEFSSRSHSMLTLNLDTDVNYPDDESLYVTKRGKLSFVDLAGSEKVKDSQTGETLLESNSINKSLLVLGNCISSLGNPKRREGHIPYRDSKLTKLLADSLGGNGVTLMIACVSPSSNNTMETMNTLRYANRAKKIKSKPVVKMDPREKLILTLKREMKVLRNENHYLREQLEFPAKPKGQLQKENDEKMIEFFKEQKQKGNTVGAQNDAGLYEMLQEYMVENESLRAENSDMQSSKDRLRREQQLLYRENDKLTKRIEILEKTVLGKGGSFPPHRASPVSMSQSGGINSYENSPLHSPSPQQRRNNKVNDKSSSFRNTNGAMPAEGQTEVPLLVSPNGRRRQGPMKPPHRLPEPVPRTNQGNSDVNKAYPQGAQAGYGQPPGPEGFPGPPPQGYVASPPQAYTPPSQNKGPGSPRLHKKVSPHKGLPHRTNNVQVPPEQSKEALQDMNEKLKRELAELEGEIKQQQHLQRSKNSYYGGPAGR